VTIAACADSPLCLAHSPLHCKPAATPFGEELNRDKALPGLHLETPPQHAAPIRLTASHHSRDHYGKAKDRIGTKATPNAVSSEMQGTETSLELLLRTRQNRLIRVEHNLADPRRR